MNNYGGGVKAHLGQESRYGAQLPCVRQKLVDATKRPLNVGIGMSHTQPIADHFLYSKQTSTQPKITNAVLKCIKDAKTYLDRAWTKWLCMITFRLMPQQYYFKKAIEATQACGSGIHPPNAKEIYNKYLQMKFEDIKTVIISFHCQWDEIGCIIMCDGKTTQN